jgi:hypothetical protein
MSCCTQRLSAPRCRGHGPGPRTGVRQGAAVGRGRASLPRLPRSYGSSSGLNCRRSSVGKVSLTILPSTKPFLQFGRSSDGAPSPGASISSVRAASVQAPKRLKEPAAADAGMMVRGGRRWPRSTLALVLNQTSPDRISTPAEISVGAANPHRGSSRAKGLRRQACAYFRRSCHEIPIR